MLTIDLTILNCPGGAGEVHYKYFFFSSDFLLALFLETRIALTVMCDPDSPPQVWRLLKAFNIVSQFSEFFSLIILKECSY